MIPVIAPIAAPSVSPAPSKPAAEKPNGWDLSFDNLLDIVNPLQHLPIIGTLYRAITGDQIAAPQKIAGGTLFGGLWGFISSVADMAFEEITGKDFGSTVLALFTGDDKKEAVVQATTAAPAIVAQAAPRTDIDALMSSLSAKGTDPEMARRAAFAYSKSMGMAEAAALR